MQPIVLFTHRGEAWANSAFHPSGSVNEDLLPLGKLRQVWFILFVSKCVGDRVCR